MSCLNSGYRISTDGEGTKSEQALDASELSSTLVYSSSYVKSIISCPFFASFSGVKTLLERLVLGEAAVSGEGGRGMEKGSSAMVNGGSP